MQRTLRGVGRVEEDLVTLPGDDLTIGSDQQRAFGRSTGAVAGWPDDLPEPPIALHHAKPRRRRGQPPAVPQEQAGTRAGVIREQWNVIGPVDDRDDDRRANAPLRRATAADPEIGQRADLVEPVRNAEGTGRRTEGDESHGKCSVPIEVDLCAASRSGWDQIDP